MTAARPVGFDPKLMSRRRKVYLVTISEFPGSHISKLTSGTEALQYPKLDESSIFYLWFNHSYANNELLALPISTVIRDGACGGCLRASPAHGLPTGICRAGQQNSGTGRAAGDRSIHGPVTGAREIPGEATHAAFIL